MKAMERLEQLLDDKDQQIADLERKLETAERELEFDADWTRHVRYDDKKPPNPELPVPRLEVRWSEDDGELMAIYSLVYRHLTDHVVFIPMGKTKSSGALAGRIRSDGTIDLPFRDGAHIANEMKQLGLRGFGIAGDHVHEYKVCRRCHRLDEVHRGVALDRECTMPIDS